MSEMICLDDKCLIFTTKFSGALLCFWIILSHTEAFLECYHELILKYPQILIWSLLPKSSLKIIFKLLETIIHTNWHFYTNMSIKREIKKLYLLQYTVKTTTKCPNQRREQQQKMTKIHKGNRSVFTTFYKNKIIIICGPTYDTI